MPDKQILRITSHYLENYLWCPLFFHRVVNLKRGSPSKLPNLARGIAIHSMLADYYRGYRANIPFEKRVEDAVEGFKVAAIGINGLDISDVDLCISTFYEYTGYYQDLDNFTVLAVEETLSKVIFDSPELSILYEGTQDMCCQRVDGDVIPYDHKTESAKFTISQLNNQNIGYCVLTGSNRIIRNAIGFQKSKPPNEKFYRTMYSYPNALLEWWQRTTINKVKEIARHYALNDWNESGNLSACDTMFRRGCEFKEVCSEEESEWNRILERDFVTVELYS